MDKVIQVLLGIRKGKGVEVFADSVTLTGESHKDANIANQDSSFILLTPRERLKGPKSTPSEVAADGIFAVGVFDGHGDEGEKVSELAAKTAKNTLAGLFKSRYSRGDMEDYLRLTFEIISARIDYEDCSRKSGTTGTIAVVYGSKIVVGHVGDSCAMLVRGQQRGEAPTVLCVAPMHRPDDPEEKERILSKGGTVVEKHGQVYASNPKGTNGLAVSRTLGDQDMRTYGCISDPDVRAFDLTTADLAIVMASDGLWDAPGVVRRDCLKAVQRGAGDPMAICSTLQEKAQEHGGPGDDCTIVAMTFK